MKFLKGFCIVAIICIICQATVFAQTVDTDQKQSLHMDWMDTSVSPARDFYSYANGTWKKNNPIPADYSSWGTFNIANDKAEDLVHQILIAAEKDSLKAPKGSDIQKVGDFYYSGMDEENINRLGVSPLKPEFEKIDKLTPDHLVPLLAHLHTIGVGAFFSFGSMQDFKKSTDMIGAALQGGLGLPDRDYYLKDDEKFKQIRQAYLIHIGKMFELLGDNPDKAASQAKTVLDIETQLAKASMSQVEQRDPYAVYNMMDIKQLNQLMPNFSLHEYLKARNLAKLKKINVAMPNFFKALDAQLKTMPLADLKTYLRWHLLDTFAAYLSKPFVDQNFKMITVLYGTEKILPRWKRVLKTENSILGFAVGKLYVEKHFSSEQKQKVLDILKNIRAVLLEDLSTLSWMTQATREEAIKKLKAMEERVGYPSKWWDYSKLKIDRGPYVLNVLRGYQFLSNRDLNKIDKPVDRTEWNMTPQTVNAYYDPSMNNLNIPAGILQPPFFDPKAPAAMNYGSMGFIAGHEMTHGFDDQGAQFDGAGNLKNWWKPEDLAKFKKATQCIVDQYSNYVVNGNLHLQGKLVVGEAVADLGGLILAYKAFQRSKDYKNAKTIEGMTPEQQFFLGAAHSWAINRRPELVHSLVTTDPHPPEQYRVNGTVANVPQFQKAYSVPEGSEMIKKDRCVIW